MFSYSKGTNNNFILKMKRYSIILMAVCGLLLPLNQGCTDLDQRAFSEITGDQFPQTEEQAIALVGAAYTSLYPLMNHNSYFSLQEISTDEVMIPQRGSDWFDGGQWIRVHDHEYLPTEQAVNNGWNFLYGGVANCNRLIAQLETIREDGVLEPELADAFVAELSALRALYYFWLLDAYGNVPIVTGFADADPNPATSSRTEVFNFVEQELLDAASLLPREKSVATYGRMTYYVVQALLAKLYLNAEVYTGTERYADAVAAADEVINSGLFALESDYFANFGPNNGPGNVETIFAIPYDEQFGQGFNLGQMTLHYQSQQTFNMQEQPWNGYCSLQEFYNSYENEDLRKGEFGNAGVNGNFLAGPQFTATGERLEDTQDDGDPDGLPITFTPEINQQAPNCFRQAGARIFKYRIPNGATQHLPNDFPVLRYADMLMTKSEALYRQGTDLSEALSLVNQVRARAGVSEFSELNDENLLAERGRELFYEGWRRQDLIRFDAYDDSWDFKDETPDPSLQLFPIPQNQLQANSNLVQNPGY